MIAVSGLLLVLFLGVHLLGVSLSLFDPASFEAWAAALHRQPWLPPLELGLAAVLLVHPLLALRRSLAHAAARGPVAGLAVSRRQGWTERLAALAARLLPWSGALLLLFLAVHLAQLRLHRPLPGGELAAMLQALAPPASRLLYVAAGGAVLLHLLHGTESAHRSLGLLEPANRRPIRLAGRLLAVLLGGGFALLPVALLLRGNG